MHTISFNLSGVTLGNKQKTLRGLRHAIMKVCKTTRSDEFIVRCHRAKLRVRHRKDNQYDDNAMEVQVYSNKTGRWVALGWVPAKKQYGPKGSKTPLNKIIRILHEKGKVTRVTLEDINRFENKDPEAENTFIYYCKVSVEFTKG